VNPPYHVLFRASWTGWKWIPWKGVFGTQRAAHEEINRRRAYADSVERIVCVKNESTFFEAYTELPLEVKP
jgi:hypothetical protein